MNLKKQSAAGRDPAVTLKESDGISYRDEEMLLSRVRRLSERSELLLSRLCP